MEIAGESLCVLECDVNTICPDGLVCSDVGDGSDQAISLCFPADEATP
jgi:hypothetical protein